MRGAQRFRSSSGRSCCCCWVSSFPVAAGRSAEAIWEREREDKERGGEGIKMEKSEREKTLSTSLSFSFFFSSFSLLSHCGGCFKKNQKGGGARIRAATVVLKEK